MLAAVSCAAETISGTVTNATTNKPAAGDDVVLLSLAQGMEEAGRTKTDARGKFHFDLKDSGSPHLIRAIHQQVTYHKMAPPGTTAVDMQVFDVANKVDGISVTADVMRFQSEGSQLQGIRLFAVDNKSAPQRTQMNDQNFEFRMPEGAKIDQAMARTAGGQPISATAVPQSEKNRFAFIFPLRPGQTEFQISFHLPYSGKLKIDPQLLYPAEHFVVMLPKSMQFAPATASSFESMADPQTPDGVVQVASRAQPGQDISFTVSGTGRLQDDSQAAAGQAGGASGGGAMPQPRDSRPGGGIGAPIDAPDPLQKYRWYILGGFGLILAAGAVWVGMRQPLAVPTASSTSYDAALSTTPPPASPRPASPPSSSLLDVLKEELFQLEIDRKQGKVSPQEYEKHKAALDHTLDRALQRQNT